MRVVTTRRALREVVKDYLSAPVFATDVETTGPHRGDPRRNEISWVALATTGRVDLVPMDHPNGAQTGIKKVPRVDKNGRVRHYSIPAYGRPPAQMGADEAMPLLEPLFTSGREVVGHNVKFDLESLQKYFVKPLAVTPWDTMVAAFLLDENHRPFRGHTPYSLAAVAARELGTLLAKGVGKEVEAHPFVDVALYSARDVQFTWLSYRRLRRRLRVDRAIAELMVLEMQTLRALIEMETAGFRVDVPAVEELDTDLRKELSRLEGDVYAAAGHEFNLNSHPQKVTVFYEEQGLRAQKMTPGLQPSTDDEALAPYTDNQVVAAYLEYTELQKIHGTYVSAYLGRPSYSKPDTVREQLLVGDRIHANYRQIGARTGRFSCTQPNLQQIPRADSDLGKLIRGVFVASPGNKLVLADWSQIEYRILAAFSEEPALVQAYLNGEDLHQVTADLLGVSRSLGKTTNFAAIYGAGPDKIAFTAKCSVVEARTALRRYDEQFPCVGELREQVLEYCRQQRPPHIVTILGRKRRLPEIFAKDRKVVGHAERQAFNALIQGSAADLCKVALVDLTDRLRGVGRVVACVHDEFVVDVPEARAEEAAGIVRSVMESDDLAKYLDPVPLVVDLTIADRWSEKH